MSLLRNTALRHITPKKKLPARILVCTHAKYSALILCQTLVELGIDVTFYPVSYSKDPKNIDQLLASGVEVIEDIQKLIPIISNTDCVIEDGARISKLIKEHSIKTKKKFFSVEQTSGGVRFFEQSAPDYPVINVAMSAMKLDIENRRATPEGIIRNFTEVTGKLLGGKKVLIIGFGSIGEGIARLAQTLGAHVTIYDVFATRRMFAQHHGYTVVEKHGLNHSFPSQDVIFMATNSYQGNTIGIEACMLMKPGVIICNAGSGRGELAEDLQQIGTTKRHDVTVDIQEEGKSLVISLTKDGIHKQITVLAKSFPINLHHGEGTSHDAIEVVMSLLLCAALSGPIDDQPGLQPLSFDIQEKIAEEFLRINRTDQTFEPHKVKTRSGLTPKLRPYGGILPFHNELEGAHTSVARVWFSAGTKTRGHYHRNAQEAYYVEKGQAKIIVWPAHDSSVSPTVIAMQPGDYLLVPENYYHDVKVGSTEDFECLVISSPPFDTWDQFFHQESQ